MTVSFRPAAYTTLSPMVVVDNAARALEFYRDAFGAVLGLPHRTVVDPFGDPWMLGTHIEDVSPAEMDRRGKEWVARHARDAGATMTSTAKSAERPAAMKAAKKSAH